MNYEMLIQGDPISEYSEIGSPDITRFVIQGNNHKYMAGELRCPGEPKEFQEQQLLAKLVKRMDGLTQETNRIANELRENGLSERALAAFVSMHECVNHLADRSSGNQQTDEKFLKALQTSLFEIASEVGRNKHGIENIARNPDVLKDKLVTALKEVLEMDNKIR